MNNEDKYLADKFGRENHFHVPDGYFDHFSSRLMERLAEQTTEGDVITVRGLGKIRLDTIGSNTKKGRIGVEITRFL